MRGFAALGVFGLHAAAMIGPWRPVSAYLAVDLFFLLSGIVIGYSYDDRLKDGRLTPGGFMLVRLIRFYPFYLLGSVSTAVVLLGGQLAGHHWDFSSYGEFAWSLVLTLLFIPQRLSAADTLFTINMPFWSLLLELLVNAAYAFAFPKLSRKVLIALVVVGAAGLVIAAVVTGSLSRGPVWHHAWVGIPRVCFSFFLGLYLVRVVPRSTRSSNIVLLACLVPLVAIMEVDPGPLRPAYDLICVLLVFPLMGLAAIRFQVGPSARPAAKLLGDGSYGIYVMHVPFTAAVLGALGLLGLRDAPITPWSFFVGAALLVAVVIIMDRLVDRPVRRRLTDFTFRREPAAI